MRSALDAICIVRELYIYLRESCIGMCGKCVYLRGSDVLLTVRVHVDGFGVHKLRV
jgi:hypothetical protein